MTVKTEYIELKTHGDCEIFDITPDVAAKLKGTGLKSGTVTAFCPGSTGGLSTVEYEPGLIKDIPEFFDRIIPEGHYHHDMTWHDGNGHSHLRATLLGPSLVVPFVDGRLTLGTWQQIIFCDFDNKPHRRKLVLQFIGE
jgi:secondary thiamine-phosphate synthase enzyme